MKKVAIFLLAMAFMISLSGCGQSQGDDPASIIENHHLETSWDDTQLFWNFSFDDMYFRVIFQDDDPQLYFAKKELTAQDIKSIQVYPHQDNAQEFIYIVYTHDEYQVDEGDIQNDQQFGRQEAYQAYQEKIKDFNITTNDIGIWMESYFNEHVRQELISHMKNQILKFKDDLKKKGYSYQEDDGKIMISKSQDRYKIVIASSTCMVVNNDMDLSASKKTGYMYTPTQGTVGYIVNSQTQVLYRYQDGTYLQGTATAKQYAKFKDMKKWYDQFLNEFHTNTTTLESL